MGLWAQRTSADAADYLQAIAPRLLGTARALTSHREDAEDLVQETLASVIVHWRKVERADSRDAYVRRIMLNHFLSRKRRRSGNEVVSDLVVDGVGDHVPGPASRVADQRTLVGLLATIAPRQRAVLVLRYFEDLSDRAIADTLGCSEGAVRVAAHRGLAALREHRGSLRESDACPEPTGVVVTTPR